MISNRELFLRNMGQTSVMPYMLEIVSASGIYLTDVSGKQYIDLISGVSVSNLGHNNSEIIEAITKQLHQHMHLMVYGEFI
ncbi:MAG TPA: aminotransferase class III-fold pyridoxal phosphate-dependent enzyme, partial [Bacteroidales bacterium]|nr:aminotransferase class III-fold pyridoxal phosphate-dependent enzyme [Bacteroidales bacterium]